jgi:hypothetical protein
MVKNTQPKYLPHVVVGIILIYLPIYGIEGLGFSVLTGTPEDFTTYTKVDPGGYVSVASLTATVTAMPRSAVSHVYKDFGAAHFGDFHTQFESQCTAVQLDTGFLILVLANNIGASFQMATTTIGFYVAYAIKTQARKQNRNKIQRMIGESVRCKLFGIPGS